MIREELKLARDNLIAILTDMIKIDVLDNVQFNGAIIDDEKKCHLTYLDRLEVENRVLQETGITISTAYNGLFVYDWTIV